MRWRVAVCRLKCQQFWYFCGVKEVANRENRTARGQEGKSERVAKLGDVTLGYWFAERFTWTMGALGRGKAKRALLQVVLLVGLICLVDTSSGQLYFRAEGEDFDTVTSYAGPRDQDTIAVYFRAYGTPLGASVRAWRADGVASRFVLRRYESSGWSGRFVGMDSVSDAVDYRYTLEEPGGYEVVSITAGDTLRRVLWVFIDDVELRGIRVDNGCKKLDLSLVYSPDFSTIRYDRFLYYDISQAGSVARDDFGRKYFSEVSWTTPLEGQGGLEGHRVTISNPPPMETTHFSVRVRTIFGREFTARTEELEPVAVLPKMRVELVKEPHIDAEHFVPVDGKPKGPSPFIVRLTSESKNADSLFWSIRNDPRAVREGKQDTLFYVAEDVSLGVSVRPSAELFSAGFYEAVLRARNSRSGCEDTARVVLQVDSSLIAPQAVPNVFSPNGDGINDVFRFIEPERNVRSIREFEITIMGRTGQVVYRYSGHPLLWEGWNGRRRGDGGPVAEGVYFYVIRAEGWDGRLFRSEEYKGALHLFR